MQHVTISYWTQTSINNIVTPSSILFPPLIMLSLSSIMLFPSSIDLPMAPDFVSGGSPQSLTCCCTSGVEDPLGWCNLIGYDFYQNYPVAIWQFVEDFSHWIPLFSTSSNQYSEYLHHSRLVFKSSQTNTLCATQPCELDYLKFDLIEYVAQLRERILETYTVVITVFKNTEKAPALLPYVPSSSLSINIKEHLLEEWIAHEFHSKHGMQQEMKALRKQAAFSSLNIHLLMPGAQSLVRDLALYIATTPDLQYGQGTLSFLLKMPAITTCSGCHIRCPPLPDQPKALEPPKQSCPCPCCHTGPKSVIDHGNDHLELSICPPPKPHPLARSKCSGPMTSSAEEEIFEATPTSITGEHATTASKNPNAISQSQTNDLNGRNVNDQGTSATCTESHDAGYSNKDHGKDTSGTSTKSRYPEEGRNDDGHKTSATSTNGRPRMSGGVKSYAPDRSAGEESSPSDSDWAVDEAQWKKAQQTADHNIAVNHGEDDEASSEADPPSPPRLTAKQKQKLKVMVEVDEHHRSEDEDDEDFVKTKGRMPQVGILKAQELGKKTLEAARTLGQEYGKSARTILIEAGLTMKATCKESLWNQHQMWFAATHPLPKGVSGVVLPEDIKAWKVKQQAHYKAHPQDDPQHALLWKEIQENWDHAVMLAKLLSGEHERDTCLSLMMGVRDAFTKSAAYWHRTHGIHIAGVSIFPGDEEAGHQASGLFASSDMVKALINSHQLNIKHWLDELTTILKYKDLEAAHAEGKTFSLLPASSTAPNALYLRLHLGAMYEAELGLDDNDNDSKAEAAKAKKRKGKSKKSGDKGRKKGAVVEEPSVILHISRWPESDILTVETQATSMCLIPLVINTNSKVVHSLQDSEKSIKDLPQDNTPRCCTKQTLANGCGPIMNLLRRPKTWSVKQWRRGTVSGSHIPLGHAQSQAHHHNHSTVRPSHIHPASPDRHAIIEEDEDEYY
ncbi:uncharacterized protein BJ212DRAFT_1303598 [Suillus subaureus]|uniref:Uncharacterized protein n=1 Tax=Suillus subaureus TaxID=48587 RepID=A0A9P7DZI4_9AGAM|nr:uncharacterized protein BJ212DRAFT_1303598 [Suillus subaureus]KAG1807139.1 hypothetical protein BJ212DRAFT_1303598 [Suillus subaureus]